MIAGQIDHPRFSGERLGRLEQCFACSNSVRARARGTCSIAQNVVGRFPKGNFATACGLWSPKRLSRQNRPFRPAGRRDRIRVSPLRKQACLLVGASSRFAPLFTKKGLIWGRPGLETMKIEKDNISITYARPFSRTIPVRTPQSASRTEESKSWMSQPRRADPRSYLLPDRDRAYVHSSSLSWT